MIWSCWIEYVLAFAWIASGRCSGYPRWCRSRRTRGCQACRRADTPTRSRQGSARSYRAADLNQVQVHGVRVDITNGDHDQRNAHPGHPLAPHVGFQLIKSCQGPLRTNHLRGAYSRPPQSHQSSSRLFSCTRRRSRGLHRGSTSWSPSR